MARIVQEGYSFLYCYKDNDLVIKEKWSLERVAAYISVIEASRQLSQRYVKEATYCSRLGMTYYELENFDKPTNHDLEKLTKRFVGVLTSRAAVNPGFLGYPLPRLLDSVEQEIQNYLIDAMKPINVFGRDIVPEPILTRPTLEEYTKQLAHEKAKADEFRNILNQQIEKGVLNKRIKVNFGDLNRVCKVVKITERYLYVDVFDSADVCVQSNMRLPKTSTRFMSRFY